MRWLSARQAYLILLLVTTTLTAYSLATGEYLALNRQAVAGVSGPLPPGMNAEQAAVGFAVISLLFQVMEFGLAGWLIWRMRRPRSRAYWPLMAVCALLVAVELGYRLQIATLYPNDVTVGAWLMMTLTCATWTYVAVSVTLDRRSEDQPAPAI
jgi:amino acid transporter